MTLSRFKNTRQNFDKGSEYISTIEPIWVFIFTILVYFSYLLQWGVLLQWIFLIMAFIPFPLRLFRHVPLRLSTPLNLPIALYLAGALIGLIVSPKIGISLGAFQCTLSCSLVYLSWVNHPQLATLMKWLIPIGLLPVLIWVILTATEWKKSFDTNDVLVFTHGLALALIIIAAIVAGVVFFGKRTMTKIVGALICIAILTVIVFFLHNNISRLLDGDSVSGRLPRWGTTIDLIGDSPFTGLGLGCWAFRYYNSEIIIKPTHAHNAYLELYSNTGFLGALALIIVIIIGIRLAWHIIKSPRNHPWYGFGIGVIIACFITLLVGVVESAPVGVPLVRPDTYYYIISPVPWILGGFLVSAHRLLSEKG